MPAHASSTDMDISDDVSSTHERDIDRPCHQSPSAHAQPPCEEHKETVSLPKVLSRAPSPTAIEDPHVTKPSFATAIFFDWDDTLLASSFLAGKGLRLDSDISGDVETLAQLKELEGCVCAVLTLAMHYGNVHIVTNAETGWVQLSAEKFLPGVVPLLSKVSVLSARSTFEKEHPGNALKWKFFAFQEHLAELFAMSEEKTAKNIISFGDSHVEREAVRAVTRGLPNTKTKSVKFAERPSMEQLRRQVELVTNCFHYIHSHDGDLDLQLTVTINTPNTQAQPTAAPQAQQQPTSAGGRCGTSFASQEFGTPIAAESS